MRRRNLLGRIFATRPDRWPMLDELRELLAAHGLELPRAERIGYYGLPYEAPPEPHVSTPRFPPRLSRDELTRAANDAAMRRLTARLLEVSR
jgi:hypothetical protein